MRASLKNGEDVIIRLVQEEDEPYLLAYLHSLSEESKSRFAPHPFDAETIHLICKDGYSDTRYYIAEHAKTHDIIAYALLKLGTLKNDAERYANQHQQPLDEALTCTYAPSVADAYQNQGLGSLLLEYILLDVYLLGRKCVVLWGGVQAGNEKALQYYHRRGFQSVGTFQRDIIENYDMIYHL
ncbi:MAG: GNAT family N-acetyltransferase [Saprospiraceae bacterium]